MAQQPRRPIFGNWGNDGQALGGVVQHEAQHQEGTQRNLAHGVGRADGQPFAQVVQADAQGDHVGQHQAGSGFVACAGSRPAHEGIQRQEGAQATNEDQRHALEGSGHLLGGQL